MLIPQSGIFPSEQITSVKLTISNSPTLMLTLNLLNQFTRHFLKWTVCLLWLAPYVDDPSVTFIWMIFTFKIGNYSCLIVVMNGPLLSFFFSPSCFVWLLIFQPLIFEGYECLVIPTSWVGMFLPLQKFICMLGCIDTVDNIFDNHLSLFRRSCHSWNKHIYVFIKMGINSNCVTKARL